MYLPAKNGQCAEFWKVKIERHDIVTFSRHFFNPRAPVRSFFDPGDPRGAEPQKMPGDQRRVRAAPS
ncbi:hypothetical protein [Nitrosospira briensis]|uniref:hypothetical protein n=1 Tax=Nitrosospira briensis TaxID=35799 RepID=UPI0008E624AB|nr:hypothetical protein [Nitrosospira briensis]SFO34822.1 hypothetical protein SAMN05216332_11194 [Nitrosospira briensis]